LKKGDRKPPQALYNDPKLAKYVIEKGYQIKIFLLIKNIHFFTNKNTI